MVTINMNLMPPIFLLHIISKELSNNHILGQFLIACVKNYPKVRKINLLKIQQIVVFQWTLHRKSSLFHQNGSSESSM